MEINWLTIVAQVVNFLILVWLLKRFLYGPIIGAMDAREAQIGARMKDADERSDAAKASTIEYQQRLHELDERREEMLTLATSEATAERERLLTQAREDVSQTESRWHRALADEQEAFLRELRRRAGEQLCRVARQALAELADAELEGQVTETFIRRLEQMPATDREELAEAMRGTDGEAVVSSAFELPTESRRALVDAVTQVFDASPQVDFTVTPEVMCGIELRAGGRKIAWSMDSYLGTIEDELDELVSREVSEGQ